MNARTGLALLLALAGATAFGYGAGGAVRAVAVKPSPTASSAPSGGSASSSSGPDLTALAERCSTLPGGSVAAYLEPATLIHGTEPDPRTQATLPVIRTIFDAAIPSDRPNFSIAAVVQEPGKGPGGGDQPIDRLGSIQFWMFWDGSSLDKGLRRWNGKSWVMAINNDAPSLTIELKPNSAAFHSGDIKSGATFALVTADAGGCGVLGLDTQGRPASGF